jgi:hypothetical protein
MWQENPTDDAGLDILRSSSENGGGRPGRVDAGFTNALICPRGTWIDKDHGFQVLHRLFGSLEWRAMLLLLMAFNFWLFTAAMIIGVFTYGLFEAPNRPSLVEYIFLPVVFAVLVPITLLLIYWYAVVVFNRRILSLSEDELSIWHEPLPCPGKLKLDLKRVKEFYMRRLARSNGIGTVEGGEVYALLVDGKSQRILGNLCHPYPDEPQFYVDLLNGWLAAKPANVPPML